MARTESTMLELGTMAPDLALPDVVSGRTISREEYRGSKGLLVMFLCPHCPFVKHIESVLGSVGSEYAQKSMGVVAINSNDAVAYPGDDAEGMRRQAREMGFDFPYLTDESQQVAKAYEAACTPDFFLFDHEFRLVYRGQFDASRPGSGIPVTGEDLRRAMDDLIAGRSIGADQRASLGCNIKWKAAR